MESSDSSLRSKSDGENGHSGGYWGLTSTFSASSFIVGEAARVVAFRTDGVEDRKPAAAESCLIESKAKRPERMMIDIQVHLLGLGAVRCRC